MRHFPPTLRRAVEHAEAAMKRLRHAGCVFVEAEIIERKNGDYDLVISGFDTEDKRKNYV